MNFDWFLSTTCFIKCLHFVDVHKWNDSYYILNGVCQNSASLLWTTAEINSI